MVIFYQFVHDTFPFTLDAFVKLIWFYNQYSEFKSEVGFFKGWCKIFGYEFSSWFDYK